MSDAMRLTCERSKPNGEVRTQELTAGEDSPIGRFFMLNPNLIQLQATYSDGEDRTWVHTERKEAMANREGSEN